MTAAMNHTHPSGICKAAILVAGLDREAADLLLDQLNPEDADQVRQAVMSIDRIDPEERRRVIDEFRRIGPMVPGKCPPGIELSDLPAPSAESMIGEEGVPPFDFLRDAEAENLSQLLGTEQPRTIALVLSHLTPQRAGEVLSCFAPSLQVEVVRRLADLDSADPQTLREVEQSLEARLSQQFATDSARAAGPDTVSNILAHCDSHMAGDILENLATRDKQLAEQLGYRPVEFDELVRFDDATLLAIFGAAEPEVAQTALLGAPPQLVERIFQCMMPEEARRLRRKLDCPGPIRLSDIEDARRQIAALAQQKSYGSAPKAPMAA